MSTPTRFFCLGALFPALIFSFGALTGAAGDRPVLEPEDASAARIATVEGITEYRLPNGLKVLFFPDQTQASMTVNITYFVGSKHESYGETGMAHLLEHLLFKGTERFPDIPGEITRRGGRANGTTWYERTNYFQTMPPTDENLVWALDLESDRMINSFVRREDLDTEMTVVRNEFEMGENFPINVLRQRVLSTAYLWHGYGRSTIGARSDIENVPIERLQAFYRRYYQPDNAVLVLAGRFDQARALELVEQFFGPIPRPDRSLPGMEIHPTYTREPVQDGERTVTVRRVGDVQFVMAAYHVPPGSHEDFPAVDLLSHVLGNAPAGRLYKALVETEKAARVFTSAMALREPGALLAFAEVRMDQSLDEAARILKETLDQVVSDPPTAEEVERAQAARLRDFRLTLNNVDRIGIWLTEWEAMGDWRLMFIQRDRIREVTPEDVARVASAYLKPSNRTLGLFVPESDPDRANIPDAPDVEALVAAYQGVEEVAATEAFEATPENIEAHLRRIELPNGMQLALLPKPTRGGNVSGRLTLRLGSETTLMGRATDGSMVAGMLMRGTRHHTRQEITDRLSRLDARMFVFGSATQVGANLETTSENVAEVLQLLGEVLREPAFDESEFEILRRERLAMLENQKSEPTALAGMALSRHLNPRPEDHPFYTATIEEQIERMQAVTLEGVRDFYGQVYGAGPGATLTLVGAFDAELVEDLARHLFSDWNPEVPFERIASEYRDIEPVDLVLETPDKANAFFSAGHNLQLGDDDPDYPAMVLANYMLGGGFLNSRLAVRLRQRDGLSYGVGSGFSANPFDRTGRFSIFAIYAPENVERVQTAVREELDRVMRDGFTNEEIEAAKVGWRQSREVGRATDSQLAGTIDARLYTGRTLEYDAQLEQQVLALAADEIHEAVRRHLNPEHLSVVKAGDFPQETPEDPTP